MESQTEGLDFAVAHIGINCADEERSAVAAEAFSRIFGFPLKNGNSSVFASREIELMKKPGYGTKGHIGIRTGNVDAAIELLTQKGISFNRDSLLKNDKGETVRIFLQDEIEGFAIHLARA